LATALSATACSAEALPRTGQPLLYVAGAGGVSVVDTGSQLRGRHHLPGGVREMAVSPHASRLYAATGAGLVVIDAASDKILRTVSIGGLLLSPDGSRAYVSSGSGVIYVVDTTSWAVLSTIKAAGGLAAVSPDGRKLYLTDSLGEYQAIIKVIDAATMTVVGTISDAPSNSDDAVAVAPDGKHLYASAVGLQHAGGCVFYTMDAVANKITGVIASFAPCYFGSGLAVTPEGSQALVPIANSPYGGELWVVNTATNALTAQIHVAAEGVVIRPDGRFAYVPDQSNNVEVLASHAVVAKIPVPSGVSGATAIVPPPEGVQFLTLSATLAMHAARSGAFSLRAQLTLTAASNGIHPDTEPVRLQVGPFITTIPAGSFKRAAGGSFSYSGSIGGVRLNVLIRPTGTLRYELDASATGANLSGASNPVQVSLSIGDNAGLAKVGASFLAAEK
jgi:DNA-binding beta-propeller fold protein YncE